MPASERVQRFFRLVRDMRKAQRRYFKDRTQEALQESKELEREVDRMAAEGPEETRSLFGA